MAKKRKIEARVASPKRRGLREWLWANRLPLAVCGLAVVLYARSLSCGFVRDDHAQILENPQVQSWEHLPELLGSHLWSQQAAGGANQRFYRPLFSVWMLAVHTVGGLEPWVWHLGSVGLHAAATWLVFLLCRRVTGSKAGAAVGAALFAAHPVHVDAVTWVSASNELLFTVGILGALLLLLAEKPGARARLWSALAFGAALFSKETAVALLPVVAGVAWVQTEGGRWRGLWRVSAPYVAVTAAYFVARGFALDKVRADAGAHSWAEVVFTSPSILLFYMKKLVLPIGLAPVYVNPVLARPTAAFWLGAAGIAVCAGAAAWIAMRYSSRIGLAAVAALLALLPALAVVRLYPEGDMTHDRYLYAPSVGLSVVAAIVAAQVWSRGRGARMAALGVAGAVVLAFGVLTFAQQKYYHDDFAFYGRAIAVNPANASAYSALGDLYLDQGAVEQALAWHRKAHEVAPENPQAALFLARALFAAKRSDEAERVLQELLRDPGLGVGHRVAALLSLASIEVALQRPDSAQSLLAQVEQLDPDAPQLHWTQGVLFERQGRLAEARAEYEREFEVSGDAAAKRQAAILGRKAASAAAAKGSQAGAVPSAER